MIAAITEHAIDRYLQRIEGLVHHDRGHPINRLRAVSVIAQVLRNTRGEAPRGEVAVRFDRGILILRNGHVVTVLSHQQTRPVILRTIAAEARP